MLWHIHSYIQACVPESGSSSAEKMAYRCLERGSVVRIPNTKHLQWAQTAKWFKVNRGIWRHLVFLWVSERLQASRLHTSTVLLGYEYLRAKHVIQRAWSGQNLIKTALNGRRPEIARCYALWYSWKWSVRLQNICGGHQYVQMVSRGFVNSAEDHFGDPTTVSNHLTA